MGANSAAKEAAASDREAFVVFGKELHKMLAAFNPTAEINPTIISLWWEDLHEYDQDIRLAGMQHMRRYHDRNGFAPTVPEVVERCRIMQRDKDTRVVAATRPLLEALPMDRPNLSPEQAAVYEQSLRKAYAEGGPDALMRAACGFVRDM